VRIELEVIKLLNLIEVIDYILPLSAARIRYCSYQMLFLNLLLSI